MLAAATVAPIVAGRATPAKYLRAENLKNVTAQQQKVLRASRASNATDWDFSNLRQVVECVRSSAAIEGRALSEVNRRVHLACPHPVGERAGKPGALQTFREVWAPAERPRQPAYWRSYSPLLTRFNTVNPAFLASEMETGFRILGVLNPVMTLRTGALHSGHFVNSGALIGRRSVKLPPQILHSPSQRSYS